MISVIIPVYNSKDFISLCIKSLLNQSFKDYEIIIVDDGSNDGSEKICDEFGKQYDFIHVIHSSNRGPSYSRNLGLQMSKGEYIAFCDSDDYCDENYLKTLYDLIKENADIACCSYFEFKQFPDKRNSCHYKKKKIVGKEKFNCVNYNDSIGGYLWNKLFKKQIIEENNIHFNEKVFVQEDLLFITNYLIYTDDMVYTDEELYGYRVGNDTLSHQSVINEKQFTMIYANEEMFQITNTFCDESVSFLYWSNLIKKYSYFFKDICLNKKYRKKWWPIIKSGYLKYKNFFDFRNINFTKKEYFYFILLKIFSSCLFG